MEAANKTQANLRLRVQRMMAEWRAYAADPTTKCPAANMHEADKAYYIKRIKNYDRIDQMLNTGVDNRSERDALIIKRRTIFNDFEDLYRQQHGISREADQLNTIKIIR